MAAADLDADAASQQEPQLVLLHGVGRREGACPPRVRDCSPGLQPEWRVGCAGAPHLLRLTAWELARRQRSHLRAGASQLRARAGAGHGARSVLLIDDAGALAPRPGGVAPADDQQHLHAALAALISLACAGDAPRGRTVLLLSCERPAALHRLLHARSDLCAGRHQLAAPFRAAPPPPCARLPRARRDLARAPTPPCAAAGPCASPVRRRGATAPRTGAGRRRTRRAWAASR